MASLFESCLVCAIYYLPDTRTPRLLRVLQHKLAPWVFCRKCNGKCDNNEVYSFERAEKEKDAVVRPSAEEEEQQRQQQQDGRPTRRSVTRGENSLVHTASGAEQEEETSTSKARRAYLRSKGLGVDNLELVNMIDRCVAAPAPAASPVSRLHLADLAVSC